MSTPSEEEARAAAREQWIAEVPDLRKYSEFYGSFDSGFSAGWEAALDSRVSTPPSERVTEVVQAVKDQSPWFTEKADEVLARIKTETTEDVMLYHDAVSVLVAARTMYQVVATLAEPVPAVLVLPTEPAQERVRRECKHGYEHHCLLCVAERSPAPTEPEEEER